MLWTWEKILDASFALVEKLIDILMLSNPITVLIWNEKQKNKEIKNLPASSEPPQSSWSLSE